MSDAVALQRPSLDRLCQRFVERTLANDVWNTSELSRTVVTASRASPFTPGWALPLPLRQLISEELALMEGSCSLLSTATAPGEESCPLAVDLGEQFVLVGSLLCVQGRLLSSHLCSQQAAEVMRFLRLFGWLDHDMGDGEHLLAQPVFSHDPHRACFDIILGGGGSPIQESARHKMVLAIVSQHDAVLAALLAPVDEGDSGGKCMTGRSLVDHFTTFRAFLLKVWGQQGLSKCVRDVLSGPQWPHLLDSPEPESEEPAAFYASWWRRAKTPARATEEIVIGPPVLSYSFSSQLLGALFFPPKRRGSTDTVAQFNADNIASALGAAIIDLRAEFAMAAEGEQVEAGVHVTEDTDGFGYWITGLRLPSGSELFLCYDDTSPQDPVEAALRWQWDCGA
eukprot:TRINITY_DN25432_c0_g1_i1.p1 TRINITY_DN25432_c0_g1~~TRINITY_DN25432_c0_g1_i1.p1  ORF type:complete len:396 (+),score=60.83 TRINITY_DN25432_c0_g1_i1:404-1591(+)